MTVLGSQPYVLRSDMDGIAYLTLNRGQQYNPLSLKMMQSLNEKVVQVSLDKEIKVVVIKGDGKGFCAGHDLKEMNTHREQVWLTSLFNECNLLMKNIMDSPKPFIAQVHGIATAAGCQLVSVCDLAVAADNTRFALPGINIGLFCSTPAVAVSRNISRKHAMEMLLTGNMIHAVTALSWGLVNAVVPEEDLPQSVLDLANTIKEKSAQVVALGKKTFYQQINTDLPSAYGLAADAMVCNMFLDDNQEGIDAFLNKRPPVWKNH